MKGISFLHLEPVDPKFLLVPTFLYLLQTDPGDLPLSYRQHSYTYGSFAHNKPSFPMLTYVKGHATDTRQHGTLQSLVIKLQGARSCQGLGYRCSATGNASSSCSCSYIYIYLSTSCWNISSFGANAGSTPIFTISSLIGLILQHVESLAFDYIDRYYSSIERYLDGALQRHAARSLKELKLQCRHNPISDGVW